MHAGNGIRTRRLHITCAAPRPWSELCRLRVPVSGRWACTVLDRRCCACCVVRTSLHAPSAPCIPRYVCMSCLSERATRRSSEVARRAARMGALKMPLESVLHPPPGIPRTRPSIARVMLSPALYSTRSLRLGWMPSLFFSQHVLVTSLRRVRGAGTIHVLCLFVLFLPTFPIFT